MLETSHIFTINMAGPHIGDIIELDSDSQFSRILLEVS
jgi:hypothetical protein